MTSTATDAPVNTGFAVPGPGPVLPTGAPAPCAERVKSRKFQFPATAFRRTPQMPRPFRQPRPHALAAIVLAVLAVLLFGQGAAKLLVICQSPEGTHLELAHATGACEHETQVVITCAHGCSHTVPVTEPAAGDCIGATEHSSCDHPHCLDWPCSFEVGPLPDDPPGDELWMPQPATPAAVTRVLPRGQARTGCGRDPPRPRIATELRRSIQLRL